MLETVQLLQRSKKIMVIFYIYTFSLWRNGWHLPSTFRLYFDTSGIIAPSNVLHVQSLMQNLAVWSNSHSPWCIYVALGWIQSVRSKSTQFTEVLAVTEHQCKMGVWANPEVSFHAPSRENREESAWVQKQTVITKSTTCLFFAITQVVTNLKILNPLHCQLPEKH